MKINVTTTIEVKEPITQEDLEEVYDTFRQVIEDTNNSGDLTNFLFINTDTNMQIEDEVEEWMI